MASDESRDILFASDASGKAFERQVADIYRALGCRVTTNIQLPGQEADLLVTRYVEGFGTLTFMVECKDWSKSVGNQEVQNFIATVTTLRADNSIHYGVMVARCGFTPDARAIGDRIRYVSLLTPEELEHDMLNATLGMRQLANDYQDQDIFDDFVEIDGNWTTWPDASAENGSEVKNVCAAIHDSITKGQRTNFFLLADYGSGKSTVLRRLQYQLCNSKLANSSNYLPVFVPLKNYYGRSYVNCSKFTSS
jgi:hypothetical protein